MGTLLLQLIGPMQSWGVQSNFIYRDTTLEPSKSGVIGLLCAALGKPREERPDDDRYPKVAELAAFKMGVRADREGLVKCDYHTAGKDGYMKAKGDVEPKNLIQSWRYYLADAAFLVGLEGDDLALLEKLHNRLQSPVWPLYLGRKAFVPAEPVWLKGGLRPDQDLITALKTYPRLRRKRNPFDDDRMRAMLEDPEKGEIVRPDQPISFAKDARQFTLRRLRVEFFDDQPLREDFRHVSIAPYP